MLNRSGKSAKSSRAVTLRGVQFGPPPAKPRQPEQTPVEKLQEQQRQAKPAFMRIRPESPPAGES